MVVGVSAVAVVCSSLALQGEQCGEGVKTCKQVQACSSDVCDSTLCFLQC